MTERTVARQSRLEDDAISITSTQASEHPEDFEFTVDRILAERLTDRKKYLIRWLNYPVERSTWEPRKNILDPAIVDVWKKRKMRETSGIDPPFDLAGFNDQLNKLAEEKAQRHRQRKAKRRRLGLPVSPSDSDQSDDSNSSVDAMGVNDEPEDDTGLRTSRKKKNITPTKMSKKPFKVFVTGDEVQSVDGSPSDIDANSRVRRKKERQDSAAGASVELARPVLGKLQEVPTFPFQSSSWIHSTSHKYWTKTHLTLYRRQIMFDLHCNHRLTSL